MDPQIQQLVQFFMVNGTQWVSEQRNRFRPLASQLSPEIRARLQSFFAQRTLDSVRVATVTEIENPAFYSIFENARQAPPLDFRQMAGITFGDTVLVSAKHAVPGGTTESLMFHELVHVVQYAALGIEQFIQRYVTGWALSGFDYYQIPLERDAYALQAAFDQGAAPASVEGEIVRRLGFNSPTT